MRIVVVGYIVRCPLGGMAWHYLQYVLGLARLGHDVYFFEESGDSPQACYDPTKHNSGTDPTYGLQFTARTFDRVGLGDRWSYYDAHRRGWHGPCADRIRRLGERADLVFNFSRGNPLPAWLSGVPARALIDTDPVFTQIANLTDPAHRERAARHTAYFTFGENIGRVGSSIPDDGFPWQGTRQPVVLDVWPVTPAPRDGMFTTVMQWDSYPARRYRETNYGMKSDSFGPYMKLPAEAGSSFELALGNSAPGVATELRRQGWSVVDPLPVSRDPWTYQNYLQRSKAEFAVVKHGYVVARSGWFSERSANYLASGRPVLLQDTGFCDWLPAGEGVIAFRSPEEACAGVEEINGRYEVHCSAAREIAETFFDARKVLGHLVNDAIGSGASSADAAREGREYAR